MTRRARRARAKLLKVEYFREGGDQLREEIGSELARVAVRSRWYLKSKMFSYEDDGHSWNPGPSRYSEAERAEIAATVHRRIADPEGIGYLYSWPQFHNFIAYQLGVGWRECGYFDAGFGAAVGGSSKIIFVSTIDALSPRRSIFMHELGHVASSMFGAHHESELDATLIGAEILIPRHYARKWSAPRLAREFRVLPFFAEAWKAHVQRADTQTLPGHVFAPDQAWVKSHDEARERFRRELGLGSSKNPADIAA